MEEEADIDRLPIDLLAHILSLISSFTDLAQASGVCRKWNEGVKESFGRRECLSFAGWKMDDDSTTRLVLHAYSLKELVISRSCWGSQLTDDGLLRLSQANCISKLTSMSLWGMTGISDRGVVQLISRAKSLRHMNIGGTFITDNSLFATADFCPQLKSIILWSCRHVTEIGLFYLASKCCKLESIDLRGTRIREDCFIALLAISPGLHIKHAGVQFNIGSASLHHLVRVEAHTLL